MPLWRKSPKSPQNPETRLNEILAHLEQDSDNPDLWVEAAKLYQANGNLEDALKCAQACLNLDSTRGDAKLLVDDITSMIESLEAASSEKEEEDEPPKVEEEEQEESEAEATEEGQSSAGIPWVPEEERPRFKDAKEAMDALKRELNPSSTTTCPTCNTLLDVDDSWCYGCGREVTEKLKTLDKRMDLARSRLEVNQGDSDALFAMAAFDAVSGDPQTALETLHKLSRIDMEYPGLWWLKAKVFEMLGMRDAAEAAIKKALQTAEQVVGSS